MPNQVLTSVENNFTKGLITEFTGLNFPENAATDTSNCTYTIVGDVIRREGIDFEVNGTTFSANLVGRAISSYQWNNPGGDGNSKLFVKQIGDTLFFYDIAASTIASPLSQNKLSGTVVVSANVASGATFDFTEECQYADGNGYLFVYHKSCEPFYVTYNPVTKALSSNVIFVKIRDFIGVIDNLNVSTRPATLSTDHQYNLQNQGWTSGNSWFATSTALVALGSNSFTVASGIVGITNGQNVTIAYPLALGGGGGPGGTASGTVTSYSGTALVINVTSLSGPASSGTVNITPVNTGYISTWFTAEGNYPSNADVWWYFKNTSNVFDPATTANNITLSTGNAPQGHYILNAFDQNRSSASGLASITNITTTKRPTTGAWFQGRVWYTGLSDGQAASGDANYYTWTESIFFSQVVFNPIDFGICYQTNDPTSEKLNSLLPTDGGVLSIVGSGTIHKLWPIQNGLLVFANNGVWFITGSQGIGFAANDYTITKISSVKVLSNKSFVDVLGLPYFWNEEGIYQVMPSQSGSLTVEPITIGTILSYYDAIPLASKKYAKGSYNSIDYTIQWTFRSTVEVDVTSRYQYDTILNYNTYNKAFYPYSVTNASNRYIQGVDYVSYPFQGTNIPQPGFKYPCNSSNTNIGFADEHDATYVDWGSLDYTSYFVTGYKVHGQGIRKFQVPYINVFSRNISNYVAYFIQPIWNYATTTSAGQYGNRQFIENYDPNQGVSFRRIRLLGRGYTLQLKFTSVSGQPFDIIGWSILENQNASV